jgi:hypothetical protein
VQSVSAAINDLSKLAGQRFFIDSNTSKYSNILTLVETLHVHINFYSLIFRNKQKLNKEETTSLLDILLKFKYIEINQ